MKLDNQLVLDRCPHCSVAKPVLSRQWINEFSDHSGKHAQRWAVYHCTSCGYLVLASADMQFNGVTGVWPKPQVVDETIPKRARDYLMQAIASIHAPAGAIMLTASAVDAMLKEKEYKEGNLYTRIENAAKDHLLTRQINIAKWSGL